MTKHFTKIQLVALNRMRERFLHGTAGAQDYWRFEEDLALYDSTFGERIGWKWDAVLRELRRRGWSPQSRTAIDWGCGSGVAGRRVLAEWPQIRELALHDRSRLALKFAITRAQQEFAEVALSRFTKCPPGALLLVSHVANELPPTALDELLTLAAHAREIIWVEAGTHADSRRLIEVRERLIHAASRSSRPARIRLAAACWRRKMRVTGATISARRPKSRFATRVGPSSAKS